MHGLQDPQDTSFFADDNYRQIDKTGRSLHKAPECNDWAQPLGGNGAANARKAGVEPQGCPRSEEEGLSALHVQHFVQAAETSP